MNVVVGVALGRILGPLMFIVSVNDLERASKVLNLYLYTDDTSATVTSTNMASAIDTLNEQLQFVVDLFK